MRKVASLPTIGNSSSTETVEVNHGQTEGATVTSENSSLTSDDKVSEKKSPNQIKKARNVGIKIRKHHQPHVEHAPRRHVQTLKMLLFLFSKNKSYRI